MLILRDYSTYAAENFGNIFFIFQFFFNFYLLVLEEYKNSFKKFVLIFLNFISKLEDVAFEMRYHAGGCDCWRTI